MSSVFTTTPNALDRTSLFGNKSKAPVFLQFVPGVVTEVCTSLETLSANNSEKNVNSIKALPHIGEYDIKKATMLSERFRYYPLLRGIVDVPTVGDPILLCSFGGQNYYLGPLNVENKPSKSKDNFKNDQMFGEGKSKKLPRQKALKDKAFIDTQHARLQKLQNFKLDFPANKRENLTANSVIPDMILEGRSGNSLRIGSRNIFPYVLFSNGRGKNSPIETLSDNSLFGLFDKGSIRQHFPINARIKEQQSGEEQRQETELYNFTLADDNIPEVYKSISKTFTKNIGRGLLETGENDTNIEKTIYDYEGPQAFLMSDRITLNARSESMFLSSNKFLHLGSGNSMTFSTSNNILFEAQTSSITNVPLFKVNSSNCYIDGREAIVLGNPEKDSGIINQAVLGNQLVMALTSLIDDIRNIAYNTSKAIENRDAVGASLETMMSAMDNLDETQKLIDETILSKIVSLK